MLQHKNLFFSTISSYFIYKSIYLWSFNSLLKSSRGFAFQPYPACLPLASVTHVTDSVLRNSLRQLHLGYLHERYTWNTKHERQISLCPVTAYKSDQETIDRSIQPSHSRESTQEGLTSADWIGNTNSGWGKCPRCEVRPLLLLLLLFVLLLACVRKDQGCWH